MYADSWPPSAEHVATVDVRLALLKMRGLAFWEEQICSQEQDQSQFLVAKRGTRIVGFACSTTTPDGRWELLWLFVEPASHHQGVGERLYQAVINDSARTRPSERFLWAVPGNTTAERFYADRGWQPTGAMKDVETPAGTFPLRKWVLPIST